MVTRAAAGCVAAPYESAAGTSKRRHGSKRPATVPLIRLITRDEHAAVADLVRTPFHASRRPPPPTHGVSDTLWLAAAGCYCRREALKHEDKVRQPRAEDQISDSVATRLRVLL